MLLLISVVLELEFGLDETGEGDLIEGTPIDLQSRTEKRNVDEGNSNQNGKENSSAISSEIGKGSFSDGTVGFARVRSRGVTTSFLFFALPVFLRK